MTKKDYIALARILNAEGNQDLYLDLPECREAVRDVAIQIAAYCEVENPRFDRNKFLTACGLAV